MLAGQLLCADQSLWARVGDSHRRLEEGGILNCRLVSSLRNVNSSAFLIFSFVS